MEDQIKRSKQNVHKMKQDIEFDQHIRDSYKNKLSELAENQIDKEVKITTYKPDGSRTQSISFYDISEGAASKIDVMKKSASKLAV